MPRSRLKAKPKARHRPRRPRPRRSPKAPASHGLPRRRRWSRSHQNVHRRSPTRSPQMIQARLRELHRHPKPGRPQTRPRPPRLGRGDRDRSDPTPRPSAWAAKAPTGRPRRAALRGESARTPAGVPRERAAHAEPDAARVPERLGLHFRIPRDGRIEGNAWPRAARHRRHRTPRHNGCNRCVPSGPLEETAPPRARSRDSGRQPPQVYRGVARGPSCATSAPFVTQERSTAPCGRGVARRRASTRSRWPQGLARRLTHPRLRPVSSDRPQ